MLVFIYAFGLTFNTEKDVLMKLHYTDNAIASRLFEGQFGLEKESLRVDSRTGRFAQSLHPFNDPRIVQDFAENQTEINTGVHDSWQSARSECEELTRQMLVKLDEMHETLWPFSNPPRICSEADIPMLQSGLESAHIYRQYLADRYGKHKMVFSGIHYNFSFADDLLIEEFKRHHIHDFSSFKDYRDRFYLDLAQKAVWYGWILDALFNASPLCDGSLLDVHETGKTMFLGTSSIRNSEEGFWNFFIPDFDYTDMNAYTASIERYIDQGLLKAPRELYYPVRIKPSAAYSLDALREHGASHIELRMIDLNPYELSGMSESDAFFCHLFLIFIACMDDISLSWKDQVYAIQNFKHACRMPLDTGRILFDVDTCADPELEALSFLDDMYAFFASLGRFDACACIDEQMLKLTLPKSYSLASRVRRDFSNFANDGLDHACLLQDAVLESVQSEGKTASKADLALNGIR